MALVLVGEHRQGDARPRWRVVEAQTLEPPPPPAEVADIHQEYRAIHEYILLEFQEQSREYAVLAAGFTLEQVAYAIVGGFLVKRALVLIEVAAPSITSVLARGGKGTVRWFRNLLWRTSPKDRQLLQQLWLKAETQGLQSLSAAEKQQLGSLMSRLEKLLSTPLDGDTKRRFWEWSRQEYFGLHNPQFAKLLGPARIGDYQVHHLYPMQYAHLFPRMDINGGTNLVGLHGKVHRSLSAVWSSLEPVSTRMKPQHVERVVKIIDRHYRRWFAKVYDPKDDLALASAKRAALSEVAELKASLGP